MEAAAADLTTLKQQVTSGNVDGASKTLVKLKIAITQFQSLLPNPVATATAPQEKTIACETLEHAVLLSVAKEDKDGFTRHVSQLKPLYIGGSCTPGDNRSTVTGLNLMFLLVENRLSEFHSELELLSEAERSIEAVAFPVRLEQFLMVGAFNQVLAAKTAMPAPCFTFFMTSVVETVRESIAECSAVAYKELSLASAQELLMLDSRADVVAFASAHSWQIEGETISFAAAAGAKSAELPSMRVISECLNYATELERIV